ncbi:MAG TPA: TMEM165/GDT1 family protein [Mycobacteriales bacterium]|jgi:putative Ca2+/H+ antiporter (TMEM165/GDT1 family)|nr:TMEM165/GDT1 family protein [Mycobacteriales bacterium]
MSIAVIATVFALIVPAELPDKTFVATLVLTTRFRAVPVFVGAALGLAVQAAIAVAAGSAVAQLPKTPVHAVSAAIFALGAVLMLRSIEDPEAEEREVIEEVAAAPAEPSTLRVVTTTFVVLFLAEWGDLTQLLTASLSAKYNDPLSVFLGSAAGLVAVAGLAVLGGKALLKVLPMLWIRRIAAAAFGVIAVVTALDAAGVL